MVIRKCQGQAILLCYEPNLLYPSDLQHVIKSWGMKITSQSASVQYKHVRYNRVLLYIYS